MAEEHWSTNLSEEVVSWNADDIKQKAQIPVETTIEDERIKYLSILKKGKVDISVIYQNFVDRFQKDAKFEMFPGSLEYRIGNNGESETFETKTGIFTIGRLKCCDIRINKHKGHISRLQCLVMRMKHISSNTAFYVVIDFWSVRGTAFSEHYSVPHDRSILRIPDGSFTLLIGAKGLLDGKFEEIHFNARECIVCNDALRTTIFPCGHCVTCANCTQTIMNSNHPRCPLCRTYVDHPTNIKDVRRQENVQSMALDSVDVAKNFKAMEDCIDE